MAGPTSWCFFTDKTSGILSGCARRWDETGRGDTAAAKSAQPGPAAGFLCAELCPVATCDSLLDVSDPGGARNPLRSNGIGALQSEHGLRFDATFRSSGCTQIEAITESAGQSASGTLLATRLTGTAIGSQYERHGEPHPLQPFQHVRLVIDKEYKSQ